MKRILEYFLEADQNSKLIKNMENYAKEKEIEQQKSKVYGQKPGNYKRNTEESIDERG